VAQSLRASGSLEARLKADAQFRKGFRASLSKDDLIDMQGTVVAVHSGGLYRVQCDAGHEVLAQLSGRMRRFRIKVVPGDRVTVGVSPYDPVRGIITFRAR
jgi:translation initiation factor IF-1